jgi:C-terminal processing protease CtpA/Prc
MIRKSLISWSLVFLACLFASCEGESLFTHNGKEEADSLSLNNSYVNKWIYNGMSLAYYWSDKMIEPEDYTQSPISFFNDLLYRYHPTTAPDGDRFSFIRSDYANLLNTFSGLRSREIGFDYQLYLRSENDKAIVGQVTYVKPNTPAVDAGVQRGWWFDQIGGIALNTDNYTDLLKNLPAEITLRFLNRAPQQTPENFEAYLNAMHVDTLTFAVLEKYAENPNYLDTVYQIGNKKIAYFLYNFFAFGPEDKSDRFLLETNEIFGRFKALDVDELVLDLRYNSGGYVMMSTYLSSMILPALSRDKVFCYFRYNDYLQAFYNKQYGEDYFLMHFKENFFPAGSSLAVLLNNLNLERLIVLTGEYTASASEQLINGLKAYMPVILIGKTTYGKNVSSLSIYEQNNPKNRWGMQPIVAKVFNSLGESDYTTGFEPDIELTELSVYDQSALGDTSELLLNAAISLILDRSVATRRSARKEIQTPVFISDETKIKGSLLPAEPDLNER